MLFSLFLQKNVLQLPFRCYTFLFSLTAPLLHSPFSAASGILHICFLDDSFHWSAGASAGPVGGEVCVFSLIISWGQTSGCIQERVLGPGLFGLVAVWSWTLEAWRGNSLHRMADGKTNLNEVWPPPSCHSGCVSPSDLAARRACVYIRRVEGKFTRKQIVSGWVKKILFSLLGQWLFGLVSAGPPAVVSILWIELSFFLIPIDTCYWLDFFPNPWKSCSRIELAADRGLSLQLDCLNTHYAYMLLLLAIYLSLQLTLLNLIFMLDTAFSHQCCKYCYIYYTFSVLGEEPLTRGSLTFLHIFLTG